MVKGSHSQTRAVTARFRVAWLCWAFAPLLLTLFGGCQSGPPLVATMCPDAKAIRHAESEHPQRQAEWDAWAAENLQDGDIVFGMGDARAFFGLLRFSKISAKMADSRYSHTGLVAREQGKIYVYDMAPEGARRLLFSDYVLGDDVVNLAVKRPLPCYQDCVDEAVRFCRQAYLDGTAFDRTFRLDDDRLYCTKMTVLAYRSAGLNLCEPIRMDCFPNYADYPILTFLCHRLSAIKRDTAIFTPGNDRHGIWSSPALKTVYENVYLDAQRLRVATPAKTIRAR